MAIMGPTPTGSLPGLPHQLVYRTSPCGYLDDDNLLGRCEAPRVGVSAGWSGAAPVLGDPSQDYLDALSNTPGFTVNGFTGPLLLGREHDLHGPADWRCHRRTRRTR